LLSLSEFCLLACRVDYVLVTRDVHEGNEECLEAVDINAAVSRSYVTGIFYLSSTPTDAHI